MKQVEAKKISASVQKRRQFLFYLAIFPMLGAIMFCSKILMEALPNIHIVGMLVMIYTVVFRVKALVPIYIYVFLTGLYAGFDVWWIPYLYIWTVLWAVTLILPKNMPRAAAVVVYSVVCALHGLLYGALYAPVQALAFGFDFSQTLAWIAAGLPFDVIHAVGNAVFGCFVFPLSKILSKLLRKQLCR